MTRLASLIEQCWLWTYTAGLPPSEAEERRTEIRSDWWEYQRFAIARPDLAGGRLRRLIEGAADDVAWRASFGRRGFSASRSHEAVLLLGLVALVFLAIPVSAWWAIALTGNPDQPDLRLWYVGTEGVALATTVVGGAFAAAHYARTGRSLMLLGTAALAATLWWTPVVAAIFIVASVATVLSLPAGRGSAAT